MNQVRPILAPVEKVFDQSVKSYIDNDAIRYLVNYIIVLSLIYNSDKIPEFIKEILTKNIVRILLLFLGLYYATKDFSLSVQYTPHRWA